MWRIEKFGLDAVEVQQILFGTRFEAYTIYSVASVFWGKIAKT
jgi:hypothetical protein